MITPERIDQYKRQALRSVGRRAKNPAEAGIAAVPVSPHDLLTLISSFEELQRIAAEQAQPDPA